MDVRTTIQNVLREIVPPGSSVPESGSLAELGLIDSLSVLKLVNNLEQVLAIEFKDDDLQLENFDSVERIEKMLRDRYL